MGKIIDGKMIAQQIKDEVRTEILVDKRRVKLVVIQVGNNQASNVYVKNKEVACEYVGIEVETYKLTEDIPQPHLIQLIHSLNKDINVNGILVQLPLPKLMNTQEILQHIDPLKDVDGFTYENQGRLISGEPGLRPCTPAGIMELLHRYGITIDGKYAVVIGRSNIVGRPMAEMLLRKNATVTILHSRSILADMTQSLALADIIVSAVGDANFVKHFMLTNNQILIDVGMNRDENGKLCGDIDPACYDKSSYYTPVPGGVGPMTIAMLMKNCLQAHKLQGGI